jgi:hypothetical protein
MVFYCHMIYSPETDRHSKTWFTITAVWNIVDKCTYYAQDTYSVHKAGFVLCRAHPPSFLAFCMSNLLHCLMPTAHFAPLLAGRVPRPPPHSIWPCFPQGPRTSLPHCPLQSRLPNVLLSPHQGDVLDTGKHFMNF